MRPGYLGIVVELRRDDPRHERGDADSRTWRLVVPVSYNLLEERLVPIPTTTQKIDGGHLDGLRVSVAFMRETFGLEEPEVVHDDAS